MNGTEKKIRYQKWMFRSLTFNFLSQYKMKNSKITLTHFKPSSLPSNGFRISLSPSTPNSSYNGQFFFSFNICLIKPLPYVPQLELCTWDGMMSKLDFGPSSHGVYKPVKEANINKCSCKLSWKDKQNLQLKIENYKATYII